MKKTVDTSKVLKWSILLGMGLTTAAWNPFSINPGIFGKFIGLYFLGVCLSLWAISRTLAGTIRIAADKTTLVLITMIVALAGLSAIASRSPLAILGSSKHHEGFVTFLFYGLAYLAMADKENWIDVRSVGAVLSVSAILSFLIGHTSVEQIWSKQFGNRFTGSFAEPNVLAGFLVLSIPVIAVVAIQSKTVLGRLLGIAGLSAALVQLFSSQSRAGYLAFVGAALTFGLIAWVKDDRRLRPAYFLVPLSLCSWWLFSSRFSLHVLQEGAVARFNTWRSINDTWKYIFIGAGPDRFQFASQSRHGAIGPHNKFIDYAGNIGWLAVGAFVLLILFSLYRLARTIKRSPWNESVSSSLLFTSLAGYTAFLFLSYTQSYVNIMFWVLMGLAARLSTDRREWKLPQYSKALGVVTLIVAIAVVVLTSTQMIAGDYYGWRALNTSSDVEEQWDHLTSAIRYEPTNVGYRIMRGGHAWQYLKKGFAGESIDTDIVRAGISDWEFLYGQVENNALTYQHLSLFYLFAGTPKKEQLDPPEDFDSSKI